MIPELTLQEYQELLTHTVNISIAVDESGIIQ